MNTKTLKIVTALVVIAGFIFLAHGFFSQKTEKAQALPPAIKMKLFQGQNPPYNFTFEYPEAWRVRERGYKGDYDMVEVMSPSDKAALVTPGLFITKKALRGSDTPESLMAAWLREEGRYKDFKASPAQGMTVAGQKGLKTKYGYALSLPLWTSNAQEFRIKKEQIIFVRGDASFQITFMGTDEQFKTYKPVFDRTLATLKFLD